LERRNNSEKEYILKGGYRMVTAFFILTYIYAIHKNKSGTVITVNNGLSYGENIYAVLHPISDDEDNLCNNLIHDGALMVRSGADINYDF
jgi:hypothetical protein